MQLWVELLAWQAGELPSRAVDAAYQSMLPLLPVSRHFRVSLCTTCMGRLHHIQKTLLKNLADNLDYPNLEFVLLDYNSSDGLESWVKRELTSHLRSGMLAFYRTTQPEYFHPAHAKNMAHRLATGDIVCNVDADNFVGHNFAYHINYICNRKRKVVGAFGQRAARARELFPWCYAGYRGRIFLFKEDFTQLGGYDEGFQGWSWEDIDLDARCRRLGLQRSVIPLCFVRTIAQRPQEKIAHFRLPLGTTPEQTVHRFLQQNRQRARENRQRGVVRTNPDGFGRGDVSRVLG